MILKAFYPPNRGVEWKNNPQGPASGSLIPTALSDAGGLLGTPRPQSRLPTATLEMMALPPRVKQPFRVLPGSVGWGLERVCQGCTMFEALQWGQTQQLDPGDGVNLKVLHTHTDARHTHTGAHTLSHTHLDTHTDMHTQSYIHMLISSHTQADTRTHIHVHMYTHLAIPPRVTVSPCDFLKAMSAHQ